MAEEGNELPQEVSSVHKPGAVMSADAIRERLSTEPFIQEIEANMRGYYTMLGQDGDGKPVVHRIGDGEKLVNESGVKRIINRVRSVISPQFSQGNLVDMNRYDSLIFEYHVDLALEIFMKRAEWEMDCSDMNVLCDDIMPSIQLFASRAIQDRERQHLGPMNISQNFVVPQPSKGGVFNIPFFGGRR